MAKDNPVAACFLADDGTRYALYSDGRIGEARWGAPGRGWRFQCLVRLHMFGHEVERLLLPQVLARLPWEWDDMRYRTGRPLWRVKDLWRGRERTWDRGIMWMRPPE